MLELTHAVRRVIAITAISNARTQPRKLPSTSLQIGIQAIQDGEGASNIPFQAIALLTYTIKFVVREKRLVQQYKILKALS